ncbi:TPA: carboxypeptidase regulatory-like domain-containing protein, partial [Candidatus Micrarchaeota archaeon]|nr:carboxypeptidase regulatory-like domain-containing protein [Candidatus Micrarchaeota archaeon]
MVKAYFALEDVYYSLTDALDKAGLPVYRFFVESVEEKGVPSFPVAAAVLFAVFAIGVVLAWTFFSATTAFQVNVSYKGVAVEGAVVTVAGDGFSQELETDSEGAAVFPGAKEGMRLSVAISKKGFKNKQTSVVVSNSVFIVKMGKERELEEEGDVWVSVIVGDGSGGAIAGAVVSFEAGERLDSGSTDSQGKYSFGVPSGVAVRVTVSKTGFETLSDSFYASEGFVKNVALRNVESDSRLSLRGLGFPVPRGGLNSNGSGDTEYSGVVVEVVASDGGDFSQAQVTLYNAFNDVELDAATAEPGQPALFSGVAVGTDAYVIVESSGFASAMAEFTLEREQTRLLVELDRLTSASFDNETGDLITEDGEVIHLNEETGEFTGEDGEPLSEEELASIGVLLDVQVVDDTGAPVSGAAVSLSGAIIRNRVTGASGIASFSDLPLASLQDISVSADGFLPFWSSSPFLAGSAPSFRVRLTRATGLNSGELSVRAYSLSPSGDLVLEGVAVSLEVNGQPYPGSETTSAQGIAVFPGLPVGSQVTANGVIDEFRGTNSTTTRSGQNQLDLLLMPLEYALHVQAVDSASGAVVAAHLKVYWGDSSTEENLFEECSTTLQSNCTFNLYTKVGYEIVASAQSYLSLSAFYTADDASTREADLQVMLLPASAPLVSYLGLYYENSSLAFAPDETAVLPPAGIYFARFALRLQQDSSETVFYTRVNKTTIPNLFIFESDSVFAPKLFDSVRSGACASPSDAPSGSAYSWIEARIPSGNYDGRQSVQFEVPIMANSSASERTSAFLDYRAASKTGSAFVTEPLDAGLTPANENAQRCTAATSRKEFTVPATSELKYSFACSDLGCLKISYEQGALSGGSGFNAVAGDEAGGLVISYNLIDFNPPVAETEADSFSFTLSNTRFAVDSPPFQPRSDYFDYNYAVFGGPYVIKGTWMSLPIALPSGEPLSDAIQLVNYYFKKQSTTAASLRVDLSLSYGGASAPQGGGSEYRYVLHHDSAVGQMGLYSSTDAAFGKPLSSIDLLVTPMLPADAIYLSLDRSSLPTPCGSGDLDLVRTSCFELDRVTGLLKYDASSSACTHYSKDPNKVSSAVQSVAFYPSCKGPLPQFTKSIEFRINTNNLYPALYAVPA